MDELSQLGQEVEEGRLVSLAEVKRMLVEAQQAREELTYEQKLALEHANHFARVDEDAAAKVIQDLQEAFPQMEPKYAFRVADLLPIHPDDVRVIFTKSRSTMSEDDAKKIVEIVLAHYTPG